MIVGCWLRSFSTILEPIVSTFPDASDAPLPILTLALLELPTLTFISSSLPAAIFIPADHITLLRSFQKWLFTFPFIPEFPRRSTP